MRIWCLVCTAATVLLPALASGQTQWERYLNHPTPENARMVRVASYSDSSQGEGALARLEEDFRLLEIQMDAGDREAVRLAFRLMPHAGADDGETLDIMVGRLVRINPTLFLESVRDQGPKAVGEAGGNYGSEYVDRFEARRYETSRRIAALKSVTRADLKAVRDRCIAVLKADLAQESGLQ